MARPARPMAEDRRRALLDEAAHAFISHGYEAASLNAVLDAARVAKSSFYHRFQDKPGLFDAVVADRLSVLSAHVDLPDPAALGAETFWPALDSLLDDLGRAARADPRALEAGRLAHLADAPPASALHELRQLLSTWGTAMLVRGRELGCVESRLPADLQRSLAVTVAIEVDRWSLEHDADESAHRIAANLLRRLLAPDPE